MNNLILTTNGFDLDTKMFDNQVALMVFLSRFGILTIEQIKCSYPKSVLTYATLKQDFLDFIFDAYDEREISELYDKGIELYNLLDSEESKKLNQASYCNNLLIAM